MLDNPALSRQLRRDDEDEAADKRAAPHRLDLHHLLICRERILPLLEAELKRVRETSEDATFFDEMLDVAREYFDDGIALYEDRIETALKWKD